MKPLSKHIALASLFIFSILSVTGQSRVTKDSIDHWNTLAEQYLKSDPGKALLLAKKARAHAIEHNNATEIGRSSFNIGKASYLLTQPEDAIEAYKESFESFLEAKDSSNAGLALNGIGGVYMQKLNNHASALEYFNQAKTFLLKDSTKLVRVINNIGTHYNRTAQYDKALEMYQSALLIGEKYRDNGTISAALNNIAAAYSRKKEYTLAILNLERCLAIDSIAGDYAGLANIHNNIAVNLGELKIYDRAKDHAAIAIQIAEDHNFQDIAVYGNLVMADQYRNNGEFEQALRHIQQAEKIANQFNVQHLKGNIFRSLGEVNQKLGRMDQAFFYQQKYSAFNDSIARVERQAVAEIAERNQSNKVTVVTNSRIPFWIWPVVSLVIVITIAIIIIKKRQKDRQIEIAESMLKNQEAERNRLARDIHDGLGSVLSSVKHNLTSIKGNMVMTSDDVTVFNKSVALIDHSMKEIRNVAHNMMPEVLLRFGLKNAVSDLCESVNSNTLSVECIAVNMEERLSEQQEIAVYRIIQELLNNILKYANAKHVVVQLLRDDDRINLSVEDDGQGFDVEKLKSSKSAGWININNRVELLKGRINIESNPGRGTTVMIEFHV